MASIRDTFCKGCQENFEFAWFTTSDNCIETIPVEETPTTALKDFVKNPKSPLQLVTARLSKIRKCANCDRKLTAYLEHAFRMPYIWFTDWCKKSGSYFGYEDTYNDNEEVDGHNSWFRFEIKQTNKKNLKFDDTQKPKDYQWWITNVFVHWDAATGNSTMLLVDPLPKVKMIIEETLAAILQSPARGLARADLQRSPYYAASLFSDVAILIEHQGVWGIRNLIRELETSRSEILKNEPQSEELHEALRHTIHVREILQTQVSDLENILAAHGRWLEDHPQLTNLDNGNSTSKQSDYATSQRPISPIVARSSPTITGQRPVASPVQYPINQFNDPRVSKRPPHVTNQQIKYRLYNAINALRSQLNRSHANESRLNNEIALRQHLLQADIQAAAQEDSSSMNKLAYLGTAFLPSTFVATLFSMSFFGTTDDGNWVFHQDRFWMFWATAIPLTLIAIVSVVWIDFKSMDQRFRYLFSRDPSEPQTPTDTNKPTTEHSGVNGKPTTPLDQAKDPGAAHPTPRISRPPTHRIGPASRRFSVKTPSTHRSPATSPRPGGSSSFVSFPLRPTQSNSRYSEPGIALNPVVSTPASSPPPSRSNTNNQQRQNDGLGLQLYSNGV